MKRKFKQLWLTIPTISTKWRITSHLNSLNIKKTMTYDVVNLSPGLGQAQKGGGSVYTPFSVCLLLFWTQVGSIINWQETFHKLLEKKQCLKYIVRLKHLEQGLYTPTTTHLCYNHRRWRYFPAMYSTWLMFFFRHV
jgi:hypothetical protein